MDSPTPPAEDKYYISVLTDTNTEYEIRSVHIIELRSFFRVFLNEISSETGATFFVSRGRFSLNPEFIF